MTSTLQAAWAKYQKLWAEGYKLHAKANKLREKANTLWADAIRSTRGNVTLEWRWNEAARGHDCVLEPGEHFVASPPSVTQ